ncbi:phage replication initiation protein, partial [Candidatus Pacearchaeota archaeon]|nr:phage replication initiation protein [Candidatus Pacearchaeota archaeon]
MALKRMFSGDFLNNDNFLSMSMASRYLYFELGMRADDEGFISSPELIIRITGVTKEDFKPLIEKGYLIPFKSGVCVITHWKIHNNIRKDRCRDTYYIQERQELIESNQIYLKGEPGQISDRRSMRDRREEDRRDVKQDIATQCELDSKIDADLLSYFATLSQNKREVIESIA